MFNLDDEFDIDENFLEDVLDIEKSFTTDVGIKRNSDEQGSSVNILNICLSSSTNNDRSPLLVANNKSNISPNSSHFIAGTKNEPQNYLVGTRTVRSRKFPGPAGLLPERLGNSSLIATQDFLNELEEELNEASSFKEDRILSQESAQNLESPAWNELIRDLGTDGRALLKRINVASVCDRAKQSRVLKVPFLALLIQNVDASTPDPCLYLSDSTGEMVGAVHREVWEELGQDLVPGAIIVLINVGVLCAGNTSSRHYLNITANNIATLYSPTNESAIKIKNMKDLAAPDCSLFLKVWQELITTPVQQASQFTPDPSKLQLFSTACVTPINNSTPRRFTQSSPGFTECGGRSLNPLFNTTRPSLYSSVKFKNDSHDRSYTSSPLNCPLKSSLHRPNHEKPKHPMNNYNNKPSNFIQKRPRLEASANSPVQSRLIMQNTSEDNGASQATAESHLDGIDTDSLFGDF